MTEQELTLRSRLESLIDQYVTVKKRRHRYVSTGAAARAIQQVISTSPLADRELDNLVARAAVAHGLGVSFDRRTAGT
jgi:hypothetical protein